MTLPLITREQATALLPALTLSKVKVLGIRGYFDRPDKNQRQQYDDVLCIITPDFFQAYNANTDPSVSRPGVAVLQLGTYWYKKGLHGVSGPHPYYALRQDSDVTIKRDGSPIPQTDSANSRFWIDIHRGGYHTTSSLGCQTIYPDQWDNFRDNIFDQMMLLHEARIPYTLVETSIEPGT